jgi:branched-chain amino acid transport system permease protein
MADSIFSMTNGGSPNLRGWLSPRTVFMVVLLAALASVPMLSRVLDEPTWLTLFTRVAIYGLAAVALDLVLGYGAMVSFGHAMYLGVGAYAVGILDANGIDSGVAQLAAALLAGLIISIPVGIVCLRTTGIAFIMITLAFAQMLYYFVVGLNAYGGDDGLPLTHRSTFGWLNIDDDRTLYWLALTVLVVALVALRRLVRSRFGMTLRGSKANQRRMAALGFPTLRYRVAAYVISAELCVVAGMLLANVTRFVSPSYMQWSVSGELIAMVVLGGLATLVGPIVGAIVWILLGEALTTWTFGLPRSSADFLHDHWFFVLGAVVVICTLALKRGLVGWLKESNE